MIGVGLSWVKKDTKQKTPSVRAISAVDGNADDDTYADAVLSNIVTVTVTVTLSVTMPFIN